MKDYRLKDEYDKRKSARLSGRRRFTKPSLPTVLSTISLAISVLVSIVAIYGKYLERNDKVSVITGSVGATIVAVRTDNVRSLHVSSGTLTFINAGSRPVAIISVDLQVLSGQRQKFSNNLKCWIDDESVNQQTFRSDFKSSVVEADRVYTTPINFLDTAAKPQDTLDITEQLFFAPKAQWIRTCLTITFSTTEIQREKMVVVTNQKFLNLETYGPEPNGDADPGRLRLVPRELLNRTRTTIETLNRVLDFVFGQEQDEPR